MSCVQRAPRTGRSLEGSVLVLILSVLAANTASAQWRDGGHGSWPSNLDLRSVTGVVLVDASLPHNVYYLDEDGDGEADLHLAFGPWWYRPGTGAERPEADSEITVLGSVVDTGGLPDLIVFELDGLVWREPIEYGMRGWTGMDFWTSPSDTVTVTGTVLVDMTYFYPHVYLDADNDSIPEYQLVFGPVWYEPASAARRPEAGALVTVFGAIHDTHGVDRLVVYELDGVKWRESGEPAGWAGGWMGRNHADTTFAYCANDSASWIAFPPGHTPDGMGGMHWPDSMFVQFWRIPPDSLPGEPPSGHFAGFFIDVHDPTGGSMMGPAFGSRRGMMSFASQLRIRLHYHNEDLPGESDEGMQVMAWDDEMHQWMPVANVLVDTESNTVRVTGSDLSAYYVLAASDVATSVESTTERFPTEIQLYQNFPNPFSSETDITYRVYGTRHVNLTVFDLLGRRVATLVDQAQPAGSYEVSFVAGDRPGGVYFVRLESDGATLIKRMLQVR